MAITMYQADRNYVTPANDGSLYSAMLNDTSGIINNRGNNFALTADGLVVSIDTGQAVIGGRSVEITAVESVSVPANSSGSICLVVDLTKTNTVTGDAGDPTYAVAVNQVYTSAVTGALTQDDLNNGGFIYELPLATFVSTATAVTLTAATGYLNDTGWLTLPNATGLVIGSGGLTQYRVRNNVVYIRLQALDTSKTTNANQIGTIPSKYAPSITFMTAGMDDSSGTPYGIELHVQTNGLIYANYVSPHNGGIGGTITYPLG